MKVWLDDIRPMPAGFDRHVTTADEAIEILASGIVTFISLDHDLSFSHYADDYGDERTGYDVASFIEQEAYHNRLPRLGWSCHSANPMGKTRIHQAMARAETWWDHHGKTKEER